MSDGRPVTFRDWKRLWHYESKVLGWMVSRRFAGGRIVMDKRLYKQLCSLKRISERLHLEGEVRDRTWCEDLMRMIDDIREGRL